MIDATTGQLTIDFKFNLPQSTNTTHFKVTSYYGTPAYKNFKVAYIAVAGSITYLKVDYKAMTFSAGIAIGTGDRIVQSNIPLAITVDATHKLSIIPYISGLKMASTSGDFSFALTFAKDTNTNILYNASV